MWVEDLGETESTEDANWGWWGNSVAISGEGEIIGTWRYILDSAFESVSLTGCMHLTNCLLREEKNASSYDHIRVMFSIIGKWRSENCRTGCGGE